MGDFKGVSEKFRMSLSHSDGHSERVVVQIGLDGLKLLNANDNRMMRSYELGHISRWQSRGGSLVLYTRTPVDVEERQTTLLADDNTVRNALDTLTCCCMQLAELLQSKQTETAQETANNLHALVVGGGKTKKAAALPSADDVEYWKSPDKAGWLQCQGEHLRNWRNRWFVLKQGYLFRFFTDKVSESVKPRGVVDLSKIQDVKVLPGRSNTIQLKTSTGGMVAYIAGTETEVVEWVSAIEGAMQKIAKHVAGVEDEPAPAAAAGGRSKGGSSATAAPSASGNAANPAEWLRQLERNFQSNAGGSGSGGGGDNHHRAGGGHHGRSNGTGSSNLGNTMVSVVGYDSFGAAGAGGGGGGSSSQGQGQGQQYGGYQARDNSPYAALNRQYSGGYTPIQGANVMGAQVLVSDLDLNYGGGAAPAAAGGGGAAAYGAAPPSGLASQGSYGQPAPRPAPQPAYGGHPGVANGSGYGQPQQQPAGGYYGQQPVAQPQQPAVSLIDQVPHQAPAYPYFQQGSSQQMAPPAMAPSEWQVHYTADGRAYYHNAAMGVTQWEPPAGFA